MPYEYEFSPKDTKDIVEEYKRGYTLSDISEAFGLSNLVIRNLLIGEGVTIRSQGSRSLLGVG